MTHGDFLSLGEAANVLGVSTRHARRLADAGGLTMVARGVVDRDSVDQYLRSHRLGRTRSWAEHTAWGAIALLAGQDADWLGATQASRIRHTLRSLTDASELVTRTRDRARVQTYTAHTAALPRLRDLVRGANLATLGIADPGSDQVDGYLARDQLAITVRALALQPDNAGNVVLRVTAFDFDRAAALVDTHAVAALDAATSLDPRIRGVGLVSLNELLAGYPRKNEQVNKVGRVTIDGMTDVARETEPLTGPTGRLVVAHRGELLDVLRRHGVTNPEIFGSSARGDDHDGSDLDLLVDFPPDVSIIDIIGIKHELEDVLGVPVDLIPRDGLKERVRVRAERDLVPL